MKATELMIGSLVYCDSIKRIANVMEIYKQLEPPFKYIVRLTSDGLTWCVSLDEIEPIPLTPEILEKNGFMPFEFGWKHTREDITFYVDAEGMSLSLYGKDVDVKNDDIKFVHELQHALRLCGLDELADNFKI